MTHSPTRTAARRATLATLAITAGLLAATGTAAATATVDTNTNAVPCGYSSQGADATYRHCGNSFILIRADWSNGGHYTDCISPYGTIPLYHDGPHRQVNAYYVPRAPALTQGANGQWMCRASQPNWP